MKVLNKDNNASTMQTQNSNLSPVQVLIDQAKDLIQDGQDILIWESKAYNLSQWLTSTRYAQKYNLADPSTVVSWIAKGIMPVEDVILVGLTLIKDKTYNA